MNLGIKSVTSTPFILRLTLVGLLLGSVIVPGRGEDQTRPSIRTMIGGFFGGSDHLYVAESQVHLPILQVSPWALSYYQREVTPVLEKGSQTQLLNTRNWVEANFTPGASVRLISVGGYHRTSLEDRHGSLSAYEFGAGLGSPIGHELRRLEWSLVAGPYISRQRLEADWWADVHVVWRAFEFPTRQMLETPIRPWLGLAVDVESSNDGSRFHGLYKVGPVFEVMSANGNRVRLEARWYVNDGNPFYERRDSGLLLGAEVNASLDKEALFNARDERPLGWLPVVWGQYDVGYGGERTIQRTELSAEIHDLVLGQQVVTPVLWYESRQELRPGDFDNVSYTVSIGAQTRIGLSSMLSQGQPLVCGLEYLHRSAHALDPRAKRVPASGTLERDSLNVVRIRVQTLGWDLPYRDPSSYLAKTEWLNHFDWRVTLGHDFYNSRDRSDPSAQFGLNWDAATIQGYVLYARGLASIGNETPDWLGELGVRQRVWKLFCRYERYGLSSDLARGSTAVVGIGFHL